jgi:ferredoxin
MFRVSILWHRCGGCPYCVETSPKLFEVVETAEGRKAVMRPTGGPHAVVPLGALHDVLKARAACPAGGIVIRPLKPWIPNYI